MNMVGVMGYNLEILGKVLLTVRSTGKVSGLRIFFYVTNKLALPVDTLLGLNTMRELRMLISPDTNEVIYKGKPFKGMSNPSPLVFLDSPLTEEQESSEVSQSFSLIVAKEQLGGEKGHWPTFSAKVEGTQEIPDWVAKKITVRVDKAQVGSDICIDGAPNMLYCGRIHSFKSQGGQSHSGPGMVVNTSGVPITLKHGLDISQCLVYGRQLASEPEELLSAYVSAISNQTNDAAARQSSSLEPSIKVAHFIEMKPTLLQVLEMHREAIALPGEPLGVTHCGEHHIKLKHGSNPVYINAYKLPHS